MQQTVALGVYMLVEMQRLSIFLGISSGQKALIHHTVVLVMIVRSAESEDRCLPVLIF